MALPRGARVGPYEVLDSLGAGGMGEVYRARDTRLSRLIALKVLPTGAALSAAAVERFVREARAASALNHPNICAIYDVGSDPPFIAMELLDGETLQERLRRGPIEIEALTDIASGLSDALEAAHQAGIVHRDVKPANVVLCARGPKLLDFGIAKTPNAGEGAPTQEQLLLTAPGTPIGTVAYMSPEQVRAQELDARTDIFSLGVVLYEMATGVRPFEGGNPNVTCDAILHHTPAPPSQLNPRLPRAFDELLRKTLQKDRTLRYQRASDLHADLRRLRQREAPGRRGGQRSSALIAAAALLVLFAAFAYVGRPDTPKLTARDTIVIADFVNSTGDPVFDGTLRQGLAVQLRQSPYLSLISDERVQQTLRLMDQPPDAPLTATIAREVCQRTRSAALLEGSIASLGSEYVLGLRATHCETGEILDEQQAQAARKEDVLTALSQIASTFRSQVGESLATVRTLATPLPEATTSSLEALKAFDLGSKTLFTSGTTGAIPLFERAVQLDPEFAMAHAQLGLIYTAGSTESIASTTKAYELRHRTSDRERFFIETMYARQVTGNLQKAAETLRLWTRMYPRDSLAHGLSSGFSMQGTGRFDESISAAKRALELDPQASLALLSMGYGHLYSNRFHEAAATIANADPGIEVPDLLELRYHLSFINGDGDGMSAALSAAKGKPVAEMRLTHLQALALARVGRLDESRKLTDRAIQLAVDSRLSDDAALYELAFAVAAALSGDAEAARRSATAALQRSRGRDAVYGAALAFALVGDVAGSQALTSDLEARFPEDTSVQFSYLPTLHAVAALARRQPAQAIEKLREAEPYALAIPAIAFNWSYGAKYPDYVRGLAYAAAGLNTEAINAFDQLLEDRGALLADVVGPVAQLQRARANAAGNNFEAARAGYATFLELWTDADAHLPLLQEARAEFARVAAR